MSFASMNAFNAGKGLSGTQRATTATFNPAQAQPLQAAPQGMTVDYGASAVPQPNQAKGSSYTLNSGMMGTGRQAMMAGDSANGSGVVTGRTQMANVGQPPPQLTQAEMQDPANAAMAGFQFAGTQDQPHSASTNPGPRNPAPAPQAPQAQQQMPDHPPGMVMQPPPGLKQTATLNTPLRAAGGINPQMPQMPRLGI